MSYFFIILFLLVKFKDVFLDFFYCSLNYILSFPFVLNIKLMKLFEYGLTARNFMPRLVIVSIIK